MTKMLRGDSGKIRIFILAGVLVLALAGTGFFVLKGKSGDEKHKQPEPEPEHLMTLEPFILNLADADSARYLKMEVSLGVKGEVPGGGGGHGGHGGGGEDPKVTVIRDTIIRVTSSHTYRELLSAEGKEKLKKEIQEAIEHAVKDLEVSNVYFTSFAMQ